MNCSSVGSCECNPERRTHQYPRCQRNADQVCPMWREESSCNHCWHYGSTEHYKARWCKAKTNLRQSALEPENGPGAPVSTHSQIVKGYAHHVLTFVKGYAHHVQWKVVSLIGSHSQRISQYTLIIPRGCWTKIATLHSGMLSAIVDSMKTRRNAKTHSRQWGLNS